MTNPTVSFNPNMNCNGFAILPSTRFIKPVYEALAKMPGFYGLNPTHVILVAINSLAIHNPAILEFNLHQLMQDVQATAAGNLTKLDPSHEEEIAKTVILLWSELTNLFTTLQLWSSNGMSYWKFYAFTNYDIILRYTGAREDELRANPGGASPNPISVP